MTPSLENIARAVGGKVKGRYVRFHPPGHSNKGQEEASAWINSRGGVSIQTFSARDDWRDVKDWLCERAGIERRLGSSARPRPAPMPAPARVVDPRASDLPLSIWDEAREPRRTPAEAYLRFRGHGIPEEAAGEALRWHPSCPFGQDRVGCMVALVRDVLTDRPIAIHRTAIDKYGKKLSHLGANGRLALGPCSGGAVKLTPDADVTVCLGIGEGIESSLSLRHVPEFGRSPVWALLNAGQVEAFPVIPGIEALWFAVDHDEAGIRASQRTAERWADHGRETYLIAPTTAGADLNDVTEAAHAA